MSVDVLIEYKDPARPLQSHPFSSARILRECWRPLCNRLGLPILQRAEDIWISDVIEAKHLLAELQAVNAHLLNAEQSDVRSDDAQQMLSRLQFVTPMIEKAIDEWDQVKELSI